MLQTDGAQTQLRPWALRVAARGRRSALLAERRRDCGAGKGRKAVHARPFEVARRVDTLHLSRRVSSLLRVGAPDAQQSEEKEEAYHGYDTDVDEPQSVKKAALLRAQRKATEERRKRNERRRANRQAMGKKPRGKKAAVGSGGHEQETKAKDAAEDVVEDVSLEEAVAAATAAVEAATAAALAKEGTQSARGGHEMDEKKAGPVDLKRVAVAAAPKTMAITKQKTERQARRAANSRSHSIKTQRATNANVTVQQKNSGSKKKKKKKQKQKTTKKTQRARTAGKRKRGEGAWNLEVGQNPRPTNDDAAVCVSNADDFLVPSTERTDPMSWEQRQNLEDLVMYATQVAVASATARVAEMTNAAVVKHETRASPAAATEVASSAAPEQSTNTNAAPRQRSGKLPLARRPPRPPALRAQQQPELASASPSGQNTTAPTGFPAPSTVLAPSGIGVARRRRKRPRVAAVPPLPPHMTTHGPMLPLPPTPTRLENNAATVRNAAGTPPTQQSAPPPGSPLDALALVAATLSDGGSAAGGEAEFISHSLAEPPDGICFDRDTATRAQTDSEFKHSSWSPARLAHLTRANATLSVPETDSALAASAAAAAAMFEPAFSHRTRNGNVSSLLHASPTQPRQETGHGQRNLQPVQQQQQQQQPQCLQRSPMQTTVSWTVGRRTNHEQDQKQQPSVQQHAIPRDRSSSFDQAHWVPSPTVTGGDYHECGSSIGTMDLTPLVMPGGDGAELQTIFSPTSYAFAEAQTGEGKDA